MSFHSLLTTTVWWEVSHSHFHSPVCNLSFFLWLLWSFYVWFLAVWLWSAWFLFYIYASTELTESVGWCFWSDLENFQPVHLKIYIYILSLFGLFSFWGLSIYMRPLDSVPQVIGNLLISFQIFFFPLCVLLWIISIDLSSVSLMV